MFTFLAPTKIIFGQGTTTKIVDEVQQFGARRIFLATDGSVKGAGLMDKVKNALPGHASVTVFDKVEPEPRLEVAEEISREVRKAPFDLVIGVGGGSVLDLAKIASVMATNSGSVSEYAPQILNVETFNKKGLPMILIPTTAGTGSEVSHTSMLVVKGSKAFIRSRYLFPDAAIVDPAMTLTMPPRVTVSTGLDALTHAIEGLMSTNASAITDALAIRAVELISLNLRRAYTAGGDIEARTAMSLAALMAGLVLNAGMVYGHSIAYTISTRYNLPHGISCAIPLPYVMAFNLHSSAEKLGMIASVLSRDASTLSRGEAAKMAVRSVQSLVHDLGVPANLREVGVPRDILPQLADECLNYYPRPNNPTPMSHEQAVRLYERMWDGKLID